MDVDALKLKRQIRDWYNKHVNDTATLLKVAEVIKYHVQTEVGLACTTNNNKKEDI